MRSLFAALTLAAAGCSPLQSALDGSCSSLEAEVLDDRIGPPANVAVKLRVTCEGRGLGSVLDGSAFELAEDGAVMSPYEADRMIRPIARATTERVLLLLDLSGSVTRSGLQATMVAGARQLVSALGDGAEIAVYGFDGREGLVPFSSFSAERPAIDGALDRVAAAPTLDDSTNLNGAVLEALDALDEAVAEVGDDEVAHGTLVTFTDGSDRAGRASLSELEAAMAATSHSSFAIGVGAELDEDVLETIGRSGQVVAKDASGLGGAFEQIGRQVKDSAETDYLISYCSPARAGRRTLEITVRQGDLEDDVGVSFSAEGFGAGCSPEAAALR